MTKEMYEDLLERDRLQISELNTLTKEQDRHIIELEKENAELKEKLGDIQMQKAGEKSDLVWKLKTANEQKADKLTKAKEVIINLLRTLKNENSDFTFALKYSHPVLREVEQFLKEIDNGKDE